MIIVFYLPESLLRWANRYKFSNTRVLKLDLLIFLDVITKIIYLFPLLLQLVNMIWSMRIS